MAAKCQWRTFVTSFDTLSQFLSAEVDFHRAVYNRHHEDCERSTRNSVTCRMDMLSRRNTVRKPTRNTEDLSNQPNIVFQL